MLFLTYNIDLSLVHFYVQVHGYENYMHHTCTVEDLQRITIQIMMTQ